MIWPEFFYGDNRPSYTVAVGVQITNATFVALVAAVSRAKETEPAAEIGSSGIDYVIQALAVRDSARSELKNDCWRVVANPSISSHVFILNGYFHHTCQDQQTADSS